MRTIVTICLGLALAGCASSSEGSLLWRLSPEAREAREAADNAKCREWFGYEPGTEAYGNCRLKLEEIRAIR